MATTCDPVAALMAENPVAEVGCLICTEIIEASVPGDCPPIAALIASNPVAEMACLECEEAVTVAPAVPFYPPEVYIELLPAGAYLPWDESTAFPQSPKISLHPLDPADYDGTVTYYFEIDAWNWAESSCLVELVDEDGIQYASFTLPPPSSYTYRTEIFDMTRQRIQFTPDGTAKNYGLRVSRSDFEDFDQYISLGGPPYWFTELFIYTARIVIRQLNPTKTRIYVPFMSDEMTTVYPEGRHSLDEEIGENLSYTKSWSAFEPWADTEEFTSLWKYDSAELQTVNRVTFRVHAGFETYPNTYWTAIWTTYYVYSFSLGLYRSVPGLGTCNGNVGGYGFGQSTYTDLCTYDTFTYISNSAVSYSEGGGDPYPFMKDVSPNFFEITSGEGIYIGFVTDGMPQWGHFGSSWTMTKPVGATGVISNMTATFADKPGRSHMDIDLNISWSWVYAGSNPSTEIALFNETDGTMVDGSELSWSYDEAPGWKSVELSPTALVSGKTYGFRAKTTDYVEDFVPYLSGVEIFANLDPITNMTVWQRVGHHHLFQTTWWSPPRGRPSWGVDIWGYPSVDIGSKVFAYLPASITDMWLEATGYRSEDMEGYRSYVTLRDCGTADTGANGNTEVSESIVEWLDADNNVTTLRRSQALTLMDGRRYALYWSSTAYFYAPNSFIVIKATRSP